MFSQVLSVQWKWSRPIVAAATLLAFSLPVLSVRKLDPFMGSLPEASGLISTMQLWGPLYALLSAVLGLLLGITAWSADWRGRHVYALALPVPRWRLALMRLAAGVVLLGAPVAALAVGGALATAAIVIPAGLHAYPLALAARFGLASLVSYALFFAISSGTARTAAWILGVFAALAVGDMLGSMMNQDFSLLETAFRWLFPSPGVFEVFTGRWMLIDV